MSESQIKIDQLVSDWLRIDIDPNSRHEIQTLQKNGRYDVLDKKLSHRIAFGTAGLRSSMESGFAHMNDVTILQAAQGLVSYILAQKGSSLVIGYDHRHHSQRFAEISASVALLKGLRVYYLGSVTHLSLESLKSDSSSDVDRLYVHTPMVPFAIDHYKASAGVMVTASHNPANDNGYKVYYGNGCQIIPPHDVEIAASINANLEPWPQVWNVAENIFRGAQDGLLVSVKEELTKKYVAEVSRQLVRNNSLSYQFIYTPMHGVGLEVFSRICQLFSVLCEVVPEQAVPDPDFPTVKFPNPEEAGALDLAISRAKASGVKLVVANDPDADRFSVAIEQRNGDWKQLTGNEIGILFATYVIEELTPGLQLPRTYLLNSTVSSQLLRALAEKSGCLFQDTLTGFKWIGNKAIDLKSKGYSVPFGYEEAIGYMFSIVNDKDGVSAAAVWLQLYEKWFSSGEMDAVEKLEQIYAKYGWFKECNGYYKLDDVSKTAHIFNNTIRASYGAGRDYPATLGDFSVVEWRDLTVGYESGTPNHVPILPTDATSQMITGLLELPGGSRVRFTCRGSGTEPKLKVYIEGTSTSSGKDAKESAQKCWATLRALWFKPEENNLLEVV